MRGDWRAGPCSLSEVGSGCFLGDQPCGRAAVVTEDGRHEGCMQEKRIQQTCARVRWAGAVTRRERGRTRRDTNCRCLNFLPLSLEGGLLGSQCLLSLAQMSPPLAGGRRDLLEGQGGPTKRENVHSMQRHAYRLAWQCTRVAWQCKKGIMAMHNGIKVMYTMQRHDYRVACQCKSVAWQCTKCSMAMYTMQRHAYRVACQCKRVAWQCTPCRDMPTG